MADEAPRTARYIFVTTMLAVALIWSALWNALDVAFPEQSIDSQAGPVLGVMFGLIAGGLAAWRRSRGKPVKPMWIGTALVLIAFAAFVGLAPMEAPMP